MASYKSWDLQIVPPAPELLVPHVLLHQGANIGGEEFLLQDNILQLHAAVGRDCRHEAGGEEQDGEHGQSECPHLQHGDLCTSDRDLS